jgi:hypothetical protein
LYALLCDLLATLGNFSIISDIRKLLIEQPVLRASKLEAYSGAALLALLLRCCFLL